MAVDVILFQWHRKKVYFQRSILFQFKMIFNGYACLAALNSLKCQPPKTCDCIH